LHDMIWRQAKTREFRARSSPTTSRSRLGARWCASAHASQGYRPPVSSDLGASALPQQQTLTAGCVHFRKVPCMAGARGARENIGHLRERLKMTGARSCGEGLLRQTDFSQLAGFAWWPKASSFTVERVYWTKGQLRLPAGGGRVQNRPLAIRRGPRAPPR